MIHQLEIDSVYKKFENNIILSDIYLKCKTRDIIGIFGKNGSGKTTFLKILYGTLEADNKFIKFDGKVIEKAYSIKDFITFLPQEKFIPKDFTVKKTINLMVKKDKSSIFYEDLFFEKILNSKISQLSGGEQKYLELKLILNSDSKFCILDEPFMGLSPVMVEKVIVEIKKESLNKGIIISDHNYRDLLKISNKLFLIKDSVGKLINKEEDLITNGYLSKSMFT